MGRTYFRRAALGAAALGLTVAASSPRLDPCLFDSRPLQEEASRSWPNRGPGSLETLVLEQIKARPSAGRSAAMA